jgi:predicted outer membrane protein
VLRACGAPPARNDAAARIILDAQMDGSKVAAETFLRSSGGRMMKFRFAIVVAAAIATAACSMPHLNTAAELKKMRDPEVAMALRMSNLALAREANLASTKAADKAVRDFATTMADEHSTAISKTDNDLAKKEIPAADSDISRQIDLESGKAVEALNTRSGHDFDVAYLDRTIALNKYVIDLIDKTLKPIAKADVVKKALDETRAAAEKDLKKAQELRK